MHDFVVVGAGVFGLTVAERLAAAGYSVLVLERRSQIGGLCTSNAYGHSTESLHLYNPFGTHVLNTADPAVIAYLDRFCNWIPYEHRVGARLGKSIVPMPIGPEVVEACTGRRVNSMEQLREVLADESAPYRDRPVNSLRGAALGRFGLQIYEQLIEGYARKQWQCEPDELLPEALTSRLRISDGSGSYFGAKRFQQIPAGGYQELFNSMTASPLIDVATGVDPLGSEHHFPFRHKWVYTGDLDRFFGYSLGFLRRSGLRFRWQVAPVPPDEFAAVNEPSESVPYHRIHRPERLPFGERTRPRTSELIGFEYGSPSGGSDVEVLSRTAANEAKLAKYRERARPAKVVFGGRGHDPYAGIANAVRNALKLADDLLAQVR